MAEEDTKMETEEVKQETPVAAEEAYVVLNFFIVSRRMLENVDIYQDVSLMNTQRYFSHVSLMNTQRYFSHVSLTNTQYGHYDRIEKGLEDCSCQRWIEAWTSRSM